ncbi:hypothetical protein [Burkholderia territorii]|nr:hypothetical protein [Burkholderia territorii]
MDVRIEIGSTPGPRRFMGLLPGRPQPVKIPRGRKVLVLGIAGTSAMQLADYLVDQDVDAEHTQTWDDARVQAADILIVGQIANERAAKAAAYLNMTVEEYAALGPKRFVLHAGAYQCVVTLAREVAAHLVDD